MCPVLASNTTSIPEVVGMGGYVLSLADPAPWVQKVLQLEDPAIRSAIQERGTQNLARFATARMWQEYERLYSA
jgi:glycosyltransferase involved in cell wall biosynthesis